MEMQRCRRSGILDLGYMDPLQINQVNVLGTPGETEDNIFKFLDKHRNKTFIFLPYNFG
jgi:hypothetical protein